MSLWRPYPPLQPARLTVGATTTLPTNGAGDTIPVTEIGWTSADPSVVSDGVFTGAITQPLASLTWSHAVSVCLHFVFLNQNIYPPGTYTGGRVNFSLRNP